MGKAGFSKFIDARASEPHSASGATNRRPWQFEPPHRPDILGDEVVDGVEGQSDEGHSSMSVARSWPGGGRLQRRGHHALGMEAQLHVGQVREHADEQARAREQHEGQRELHHHERGSQRLAGAGGAMAAGQQGQQPHTRGVDRGDPRWPTLRIGRHSPSRMTDQSVMDRSMTDRSGMAPRMTDQSVMDRRSRLLHGTGGRDVPAPARNERHVAGAMEHLAAELSAFVAFEGDLCPASSIEGNQAFARATSLLVGP
jgi:hypothetical protein